jgi:hypothetical protein
MKWPGVLPLLVLSLLLAASEGAVKQTTYKQRNPELGIVYNPPDAPGWGRDQWDEVFNDPAPPAAWAILPLGREGCSAITSSWLTSVSNKRMRPALIMDPFLTKNEIEKTIDCAIPLGIRRVILDEYISYHTKNLKENLCAVIGDARQIYENAKRKYPGLQLDINDNWHTWMVDLSRNQAARSCGSYPYFQFDQTGISVLSKYGNPATGQCGHPTVEEMREQVLDAEQTVRDFARTRKIFLWQLNQHWYPGGAEVLQFFRETKKLYRWNRFFLFGPRTDGSAFGEWDYKGQANREGCFSGDFNWHLPARTYLIKMTEGKQPTIQLSLPSTSNMGTLVPIDGTMRAGTRGIAVQGVQLQITAPVHSLQRFQQQFVAPPNARIALIGMRVNLQLPHKITGPAAFQLERVRFSRTNSSGNLVLNSEFNNGLNDWINISNASVSTENNNGENYLQASASPNQSISITSLPVFVTPGRSYSVQFDARILQEARNNGYFFVSWYTLNEVRRDRIFMKFPEARTVAQTNSDSQGRFLFQWSPPEPGVYSVAAFFPGSPAFQPGFRSQRIQIN